MAALSLFKEVKSDNAGNETKSTELLTNVNKVNHQIHIQCKYICEKKKRQCKFTALKNFEFCVEHVAYSSLAPNEEVKNAEKRVVCPLDNKHSVYEKNLAKHLKKCNAKEKTLGLFDVKNINLYDDYEICKEKEKQAEKVNKSNKHCGTISTYRQLSETELQAIVQQILDLDKRFKLFDLPFEQLHNEFIETELCKSSSVFNEKHLTQISSIVSHIDTIFETSHVTSHQKDALSVCMVELGAGRGRLSYWLEQSKKVVSNQEVEKKQRFKRNVLLVERGSQRNKVDTLLRVDMEEAKADTKVERIRIDLKDLYLNNVELIQNSDKYLLYGKHLCGVATDYSIRCLRNSLIDTSIGTNQKEKFMGFALALCCHHQCVWENFCGRKFFENLNLDSRFFDIIISMTSWATSCSDTISGNNKSEGKQEDTSILGFARQDIGRMCKNLIDLARIDYINNLNEPCFDIDEKMSFEAKLIYYVDKATTLENSMLLVRVVNNKFKKVKL